MHHPTFREKVYNVAKQIPRGRVATYAQIAVLAGYPRAARAVGNALSKNRSSRVPCHRVIRADGQVGGFVSGRLAKEVRLKREGISIIRHFINFNRYGWRFSQGVNPYGAGS